MSKHNYSQYSKKQNNDNKPKVEVAPVEPDLVVADAIEMVVENPVEVKMEVEQSETAAKPVVKSEPVAEAPKPATGIVSNCSKLNVRVAPNAAADVVCVLDAKSEVKINLAKSNKEWFSVCTASGIEGYCMRKYVEANL